MNEDASITFGPLKIWVHSHQYATAKDYDDADWLFVTAQCDSVRSCVKANGSFIRLSELKQWKEDLEKFQKTLIGTVELPTIEPELSVTITGKGAQGHLNCEIRLTPDHLSEQHHFFVEADQSYLPGLITQLSAVLRAYPIRQEHHI